MSSTPSCAWAAAIAAILLGSVACDSSGDSAGMGGSGGSGGAGGGAGDPCSAEALAEPTAATTYYVAIGEPGADNEACDGLAPTDEGGGRCPFKDFDSPVTLALLDGVAGVRVEVREGTYMLHQWEGL